MSEWMNHMSKFKAGDAVRVKAGLSSETHCYTAPGFVRQMDKLLGKRLIVTSTVGYDRVYAEYWAWLPEWLEPWNDSEEWDGEKWVAKNGWRLVNCEWVNESELYTIPAVTKHKPAIVILREDGILKPSSNPTVHESTSKAKAEAKRLAEKHKGQEFVVFQEVDMKKVEKPVYPELQRGDVMKAIRETKSAKDQPIANGEVVIVRDDGTILFGVERGTEYLALKKSDFVKIGHVDV